jgi:hypothetical protein
MSGVVRNSIYSRFGDNISGFVGHWLGSPCADSITHGHGAVHCQGLPPPGLPSLNCVAFPTSGDGPSKLPLSAVFVPFFIFTSFPR